MCVWYIPLKTWTKKHLSKHLLMLRCLGFVENYTRWMSYCSACVSGELSLAHSIWSSWSYLPSVHLPRSKSWYDLLLSKTFSNLTVFNTMVNDPFLVEKAKRESGEEGQRKFQKVYINLSYLRFRGLERSKTHVLVRDCPQLWLCSFNSARKLQ